jgi:hypothetical protein
MRQKYYKKQQYPYTNRHHFIFIYYFLTLDVFLIGVLYILLLFKATTPNIQNTPKLITTLYNKKKRPVPQQASSQKLQTKLLQKILSR